jgi:hypothetical protein
MNTRARTATGLSSAALALALLTTAPVAALDSANTGSAIRTNGVSASAPASAGLLNDWLRARYSGLGDWDLGGTFRLRYMDLEGAARSAYSLTDVPSGTKPLTTPVNPNTDFIQNKPNSTDELLTRLTLHAGYTPVLWASAYAEFRSSIQQWDQRHPSPDSDVAMLRQAKLTLGDPANFPLVTELGRQEMTYGDQRFIGNSDWNGPGRTFDAFRFHWIQQSFWIDAFVAHVVIPYDGHFNPDNQYDWLSGIYASTKNLIPWQDSQFYVLGRDASEEAVSAAATNVPGTPATARDICTFGLRWKTLPGMLGGWDYSLEAAGQLGTYQSSLLKRRLDQQAWGVFANGSYTWRKAWSTPSAGLGFDANSGDSDPTDGKNQTFDNILGSNRGLYQRMDLVGLRNTQSPSAFASFKPIPNLTLTTSYRLFWLSDTHDYLYPYSGSGRTENGYGIHPNYDPFVGSQLDLTADIALNSWLNFQIGYGHFFVGTYIRQSVESVAANGAAVDADLVYVQANFRF